MIDLFGKSKNVRWPYLDTWSGTKEKFLGFGHGAVPRAQIRGVFHCTALFTEILRCEHVFTAEKVLPFIGASVRGRAMFPRPKAPPGHAHGARRATFWPGPPAARMLKRQTACCAATHKVGRGWLPPRKCWAWVMRGPYPPQTPSHPLRWPL